MEAGLFGLRGTVAGRWFPVGDGPLVLGRGTGSDVVLATPVASRVHAEVRADGDGYVLADRGSRNGTVVNDTVLGGAVPGGTTDGTAGGTAGGTGDGTVRAHRLAPGDVITVGEESLGFRLVGGTGPMPPPAPALRVTVSGGGPVGLAFALTLDHLMGPRASVTVYDGRWTRDGGRLRWKTPAEGNARRQQVVTVQSRQFLALPAAVRERVFTEGDYTEMWPTGPDSVDDVGPRNVRIAHVEDRLLELAGESARIRLVPAPFDPATAGDEDVLAVCEGARSATREHFADRFGAADTSMYSHDGEHLQDVVLGLRVRSTLPDPAAVLLTVTQNRFLLNSLRGEGFLNMRLTRQEAGEAVGIDPVRQLFTPCIQTAPCLLERSPEGDFRCAGHQALFLPAVLRGSPLWNRVLDGLRLFGVAEEDLTAVTAFRLDMVARPRFSAQLTARTFGFLLGDAANAIHFWPGRGLNSGLTSAVSLARCLATTRPGTPLRDADFSRHEAVMSLLQYRHKSRAWRQMVTADTRGALRPIRDLVADGIAACTPPPADATVAVNPSAPRPDRAADIAALLGRAAAIRTRLAPRLPGLPGDDVLRAQLEQLSDETLHTLRVSEAWDAGSVGGEEVDVEWLLPQPGPARDAAA